MRHPRGFIQAALIALGLVALAPALEAVAAVDLGRTVGQAVAAAE